MLIKRTISLIVTILMLMMNYTTISYAAVLKAGDQGEQVIELQRMLIARGLMSGEADGIYGEKTINAVKRFQSSQGLEVDGICGDETFNLLMETVDTTLNINDVSAVQDDGSYVIKYGMRGDDVAELQNILIALGYMSGEADGICGTSTVDAIKSFQSSHGLAADGVCGAATFDMINIDAESYMAGNMSAVANNQTDSSDSVETSTHVDSIVKAGMSGAIVVDLQKKLIARGFLNGQADGICGEATVNAIKRFQQSQGLVADGVAGIMTLSRLNDSSISANQNATVVEPSSNYAEIGSVIKSGMHGEGVADVQRKLIEHGFLSGQADGICGARTVAAIKRFQASVGLTPDGVCGLQTYAALEDADYNISDTSWTDVVEETPTLGKSVYVEATAYSPFDPGVGTYTARGNVVRRGIIAVDPSFIPLGTRVYIPGYGEAVADDTGGAIRGNRIDIAFDTYEEALSFGRQHIEIYILDN